MTVLVRCHDVGRTFGAGTTAVPAVRAVNCQVHQGDLIAVTGRSGSGKSTLLHLMGDLDRPTSGVVSWPGLSEDPGRVGFVFQAPSLLGPLDVCENVALPLLFADIGEAEARRRAEEALEVLGIADLGHRLPHELSGGQAQRVAVARVLAARSPLVLADEPTARLDPEHRDRVIDALLAFAERTGAALVVATHDVAVAARFTLRWRVHDGLLDPAAAETARGQGASTC
ncbi:ABC transporter ATP-binding protein [Nocardia yunnanensis]|uniref:ABC transporter ATP-binding protein n=1 Tax=Nocardia yunnanensis TaxID=2382165 RepID=A0A386ZA71_9NOCA|nr:ABC transporter ATP-binding protein [Nocardia yunnanensis]AYF74147.1 ABC transporter ATP-binding protein [Nocardia yunnanensis]